MPHEVIINALKRYGFNRTFIEYIRQFLKMRYCSWADHIEAGVAQGDPLSTMLFCISINPILEKFTKEYGFEFTAYADDIIFMHKDKNYLDIINIATEEFKKIGLEIKMTKCNSTAIEGNSIDFLNQKF